MMQPCKEPHEPVWESFDWWRNERNARYGRPPSPFPASFETPRQRCSGSDDENLAAGHGDIRDVQQACGERKNDEGDNDNYKLSWPLCSGPTFDVTNCDTNELHHRLNQHSKKKSQRTNYKRPAWIPPSNMSKSKAIFHPPPYTNRCKETIFDTKNVHPMKMTRTLKLKA